MSDTSWSNPLNPPPGRTIAPNPLPFAPGTPAGQGAGGARGAMRPQQAAYIPTSSQPGFDTRPMSDVGTPYGIQSDLPANNQIPGLMHGLTAALGKWGSHDVAENAIGMGNSMLGATKAFAEGQYARLRNDKMAMENYAFKLDRALESQLRDYREAYHLYGPEVDASGNIKNKGDAEKFHSTLEMYAQKHNDQTLLTALHDKNYDAVDRYIRWLDGHGETLKDIKEQLGIDKAQIDIENAKKRGEALDAAAEKRKREENDRLDAQRPYMIHPNQPSTEPAPKDDLGSQPAPQSGEKSLNWPPEYDKPVVPEPAPDVPVPPEPPEEHSEAAPAVAPGRQPTRLAMADTGTMSDVSPVHVPSARGVENVAEAATPAATTAATPAPAATPAERAHVLPTTTVQIPTGGTYYLPMDLQAEFNQSPVLQDALKSNFDPAQVNSLAQSMANGNANVQTLSALKKSNPKYLNYAIARRFEIEREMNELETRTDIHGEAVYRRLNQINPEFSNTLREYVEGRAPIPSSAWNNRSYGNRAIHLGAMVDPSFNQANFKIRAQTRQGYANGADARNVTSVATMDVHAGQMLKDIEIVRPYVGLLQRYGMGSIAEDYIPQISQDLPPEVQAAFHRLSNDRKTVATEYARAVSGAAPHAGAMDGYMAQLDLRRSSIDGIRDTLIDMQTKAHARLDILIGRYAAVLGDTAKKDPLYGLYRSYAQGVQAGNPQIPGPNWTKDTPIDQGAAYGNPSGDALGSYAQPDKATEAYVLQRIQQWQSTHQILNGSVYTFDPASGKWFHGTD